VAQWESGKNRPKFIRLTEIATALKVTTSYLMDGANNYSSEEVRPVDIAALDAGTAKRFAASAAERQEEIWEVLSDVLLGAGYQIGDYIVIDLQRSPKWKDIVVVAPKGRIASLRLYFPPYGFAIVLGKSPEPITVDRADIRGVVVGKFSLS
jgi:transcriptional regulator with XRE-family HTH domain